MKRASCKTQNCFFIVAVIIIVFAFLFTVNATDDNAKVIWFTAYGDLENAQNIEDEKGPEAALPIYEKSLAEFKEIKERFPDWNMSIVQYRIKLCENKVNSLKKLTDLKKTPSKKKDSELTKSQSANFENELDKREAELQKTLNLLEDARKEAERGRKASEEMKNVLKEKFDIEKKYALLSDEFKRLQTEKQPGSESMEDKEVISRLNASIESLKKINDEFVLKVEYLQKQELDLKSQKEQLSKENELLQAKLTDEKKSAKDSKTEETEEKSSKFENLAGEFKEQNSRLKDENAKLKYELEKKNIQLTNLSRDSNISETIINDFKTLKMTHEKVLQENDKLWNGIEAKEKELSDLAQYCSNLKAKTTEMEKIKEENSALRALATKIQEDLKSRGNPLVMDTLKKEKEQLAQALSKKNEEVEKLKQTLESSQKKNEALQIMTFPPAAPAVAITKAPSQPQTQPQTRYDENELKVFLEAGAKAYKDGNRESAIWHFSKILTQNPDNVQALNSLASIYFLAGDDAKASEYLEKSLRYDPENNSNLTSLSYIYIRQGQYMLALSSLAKAVSRDPNNPELLRFMGVACSGLGWKNVAEQHLRKSLELKPDSAETAFNLAVLLAGTEPKKLDEAQKWYKKSLELGGAPDKGLEKLFKK